MPEPEAAEICLLKSRTNPFPVKGELRLADGGASPSP
jgi:hypothetical protein